MQLFTLYVGQGNLAVVVGANEAIIVDAHIPPRDDKHADFIKGVLAEIVAGKNVVGLMLTGFDCDHADPRGVAWIVRRYQPSWVMYPQYFKESETAAEVFGILNEAERRRRTTARPLSRRPVRLDKPDNRFFNGLSEEWSIELFSPHPEDMNCSNNCSLVAKIVPMSRANSGFSYLVTGDTENDRWETINRIFGRKLRADVLAAPHHGSKGAANRDTVDLVKPTHVLVSAGVGNAYGHPDQEAMDTYDGIFRNVYSTHNGKSWRTYRDWFGVLWTESWKLKAKAA